MKGRFLNSGKATPLALSAVLLASESASTSDLSAVGAKLAAKLSLPGALAPLGTLVPYSLPIADSDQAFGSLL